MEIFVFGSNLAGIHGAGAAKYAVDHYGAQYGVGEGITGNSYALPTKDENIKPRSLNEVEISIFKFIGFANMNPQFEFKVTAIGCGLAGFTAEQIAPFFEYVPKNCLMPPEFRKVLGDEKHKYWEY